MSPINNTWDGIEQTPDGKRYGSVHFRVRNYKEMIGGLSGLMKELQPLIAASRQLHKGDLESKLEQDIQYVEDLIQCGRANIGKARNELQTVNEDLFHRAVRHLKAGILYSQIQMEKQLKELKETCRGVPAEHFQEFETRIHELQGLAESGVFEKTKPADLFLDILKSMDAPLIKETETVARDILSVDRSIPLLDRVFRERCLAMLATADANIGTHNQYDSVIREAAAILEDRIKQRSCLQENGDILVGKAFNKDNPILRVSPRESEQNGVLLLFKGYTAFVRNDVAHNLVPLTKERTVQLLGFIDYLLSLVQSAEKVK